MVKRISATDLYNGANVMLVLKRHVIEVRAVMPLRTKLCYTINPYKLTYSAERWPNERKPFSIFRNNPYPWLLRIKCEDANLFVIDSEKDIEVFKNYIRELRAVS